METCTLKSKVVHAFYWTHFKDNNWSLMNWYILPMKFLKGVQWTRKKSRGEKGKESFAHILFGTGSQIADKSLTGHACLLIIY